MKKFGSKIVKARVVILILALILLIPAGYGYLHTRINYDIMSYLPKNIETMKGQDILIDEYGTGAYSLVVIENMKEADVIALKEKMEQVDDVEKVIWSNSFLNNSIPISALPDKLINKFNTEDSTLMAVIFKEESSAESTMDAIHEIKKIANKQCLVSGMAAVVTDIKDLSDKEVPIYVILAVVCAVVVLSLTMDSFLAPFLFLISIGIAILYNLGSDLFFGQISYITNSLAAVLQLGVTLDYSIFLWHAFEEQQKTTSDHKEAMANAINETLVSITGSSVTTVAGFVALCFMSFTLGLDLGIVMAKGVLIGVISCVTILPSLLLLFDKALTKTSHKKLLPSLEKPMKFVNKHYITLAIIFLVLLVPAIYGKLNTKVYYDLAGTLPKELDSVIANSTLEEKYEMNTVSMVLVDKNLGDEKMHHLTDDINNLEGIKSIISLETLIGPSVPVDMLPDKIRDIFCSDKHEMFVIFSEYPVASDEVNDQCDMINKIIKRYDKTAMLVGEAPCTKDLIEITDHDFAVVSAISILAVFIIIMLVLRSLTLPIILVSVIEFAIFVNMGIPFYTKTELPFIASIVIGTIQLGATVDYAILMTTRYKKERIAGASAKEAVSIAHVASTESVLVSALSFFAATFGVGLYSNIDMISSLCTLMARGALISMATVLLVLPSMLIIFDKLIIHTSLDFKEVCQREKELKALKKSKVN